MAPDPHKSRAGFYILWGSIFIVLVAAAFALRSLTSETLDVRVAKASYQDIVKSVATNGKVEPTTDFQAHAPAPGVVQQISVKVGDKVTAGQLLLRMDDSDARARLASATSVLRAAELTVSDIQHGGSQEQRNSSAAQIAAAQLQRRQDASSLAALQKLQQQGAASTAEVAAAQHRLRVDEDSLNSLQTSSTQRYGAADRAHAAAQLADAQAAVAAAQAAVANEDVHSPIAGTVYAVPVTQYEYVATGDNLVDVADLNRVRITAYFDEPEIGNLADGQPVSIVWNAKPNQTWAGHLSQAPSNIVSYGTRNVGEATITVDNAQGELVPGTNVTVTVTTANHPHVLSVPREALHTDGGDYVFRVINNKLVRTPIRVGIVNLIRVEVLSGLSDGDTVALNAANANRDLTDGLKINPVPVNSAQ